MHNLNKNNLIFLSLIIAIVSLGAFLSSNNETKKKVRVLNEKMHSMTYERYPGNFLSMPQWNEQDDEMVHITPSESHVKPFYIDAYEAVIAGRRAYSVAGQTPTTKLLYSEAQQACEMAGKRLCTITEWKTACRGGSTKPATFLEPEALAKHCDFARSKGYDKFDYPGKTNSHPQCNIGGVYHMIGNLSEFAQDTRGQVAVMGLTYYDAHITDKMGALSHACETIVIPAGQYPANKHNEGMGFRCCRDNI